MSAPRVVAVAPESPAAAVGLQVGDELVSFNGQVPRDVIEYQLLTDEADLQVEVKREAEELAGAGSRGEAFVQAIMNDYKDADLSSADRAMLDYAVKLTRTPERMNASDIDALRERGFSDDAVSEIAQIAAMFNYYNRIADGLGIDHEPEWSA